MKYYVTGLVRCIAGLEVDADSIEDAMRVAKEKCLHGDPLEIPEFDIESVVRTFGENDSSETVPAEEIAKACDRLEELFNDDNTEGDEPACTKECGSKSNKNKKCCSCKKKPCSESFECISLFPLIDWLESLEEGDDEWDCV